MCQLIINQKIFLSLPESMIQEKLDVPIFSKGHTFLVTLSCSFARTILHFHGSVPLTSIDNVGLWTILSRIISNWSSWIATNKSAWRVSISSANFALCFWRHKRHFPKLAKKEVGVTSGSNCQFKRCFMSKGMVLAWLISVSYYPTMSDQSQNGSRVLASYSTIAKECASLPWREEQMA